MKRLFNSINRYRILKVGLFSFLRVPARILGIPGKLIDHARNQTIEHGIEYGAGLLWWILCVKLGFRIPRYNIFHLIDSKVLEEDLKNILKPRLSEYRIAKQYYLLESNEADQDFRAYATQLLKDRLHKTLPITTEKQKYFQPSGGFSALCEITDFLKRFNIDSFPISGTLLGLVREGKLLAHDYDIDIGVFVEQINTNEIVVALRSEKNFVATYLLQNMLQVTHKNGTVIDIFIHHVENGKCWHGTDIHRWYNTTFELRPTEFQGYTFLTPKNSELYLEENYGDWRQRPLFWDYSFDTPNQQFPCTRKAVYFLVDRVLDEMAKSNPDRYRVEKGLEALSNHFSIDIRR